jgi:hypothetical protein
MLHAHANMQRQFVFKDKACVFLSLVGGYRFQNFELRQNREKKKKERKKPRNGLIMQKDAVEV